MATEIKVDISELDNNITDMCLLKEATDNYISTISFEKSKGASIDGIAKVHKQLLSLKTILTDLYGNTEKALQLTKDNFSEMDDELNNYFAKLGVDKDA